MKLIPTIDENGKRCFWAPVKIGSKEGYMQVYKQNLLVSVDNLGSTLEPMNDKELIERFLFNLLKDYRLVKK